MTTTTTTPEDEELQRRKKEAEEASKQLEAILASSRPKNAVEGVTSGVSNIVAGAVGAVGVAILAPTVGLAAGTRSAGLLGGVVGLTGGAVIGAVGAAAFAVGGKHIRATLCDFDACTMYGSSIPFDLYLHRLMQLISSTCILVAMKNLFGEPVVHCVCNIDSPF